MTIKSVFDSSFSIYGKVITEIHFDQLLSVLTEKTPKPSNEVLYVPSESSLEQLPDMQLLSNNIYGGMPIQIGYCNGSNHTLNCLEYHRGSEINIAADDIILLIAPLDKINHGTLDTSVVEAFKVPAGTAVQLYETTLHYAPCTAADDGFRVAIVLPRGTNTEKPQIQELTDEDKLLWARNKWLIAHPDSPEAKQGAFIGLTGSNITV